MRRLAAAVAKCAHLPGGIAHHQCPFDAEVHSEEISGARDLGLVPGELPGIVKQRLSLDRE